MNMLNKIWIGIIIFLLCVFIYWINRPIINTPIISVPVEQKITPEDKKIMPTVEKKVKVNPVPEKIGFKENTNILIDSKLNTIQTTNYLIDYGAVRKIGLFGGAGLTHLNGGLFVSLLYVWRINVDCLVGVRDGGAGISYQVFNNTAIGAGYMYNWNHFTPTPQLYIGVGF